MSTSDKVFYVFASIAIFIDIIISAVDSNLYAVGGWIVALITLAGMIDQKRKTHEWKIMCDELAQKYEKMKIENIELMARIRGNDDRR